MLRSEPEPRKFRIGSTTEILDLAQGGIPAVGSYTDMKPAMGSTWTFVIVGDRRCRFSKARPPGSSATAFKHPTSAFRSGCTVRHRCGAAVRGPHALAGHRRETACAALAARLSRRTDGHPNHAAIVPALAGQAVVPGVTPRRSWKAGRERGYPVAAVPVVEYPCLGLLGADLWRLVVCAQVTIRGTALGPRHSRIHTPEKGQ